jgi:hypothetical protein
MIAICKIERKVTRMGLSGAFRHVKENLASAKSLITEDSGRGRTTGQCLQKT